MNDYRQQRYSRELKSKRSARREFTIIALLLIPVGLGAMMLLPGQGVTREVSDTPTGISISLGEQLQRHEARVAQSGLPLRQIPAKYARIHGAVDDRYTLAEDPETGEMLIHDTLGSVGSNTTSVEGDRAQLADDMVDLVEYAQANRGKMPKDAYDWLMKVSRKGMQLAFGAPGLPPSVQPPIKKKLLAELHHISANPTQSIYQSDQYLALEKVFQNPENAYLQAYAPPGPPGDYNYLGTDPIFPAATASAGPAVFSPTRTLSTAMSPDLISPTSATLASANSPYNYSKPPRNTLTASTAPTTATMPTATAPSSGLSIQPATSTSSTSMVTKSPDDSSTSVAGYYDTVLGTNLSSDSTNASTSPTYTSSSTTTTNSPASTTTNEPTSPAPSTTNPSTATTTSEPTPQPSMNPSSQTYTTTGTLPTMANPTPGSQQARTVSY